MVTLKSDYPLFSEVNLAINSATVTGNTIAALASYRFVHKTFLNEGTLLSITSLAGRLFLACLVMGVVFALPGVGVYFTVVQPWSIGFLHGVMPNQSVLSNTGDPAHVAMPRSLSLHLNDHYKKERKIWIPCIRKSGTAWI